MMVQIAIIFVFSFFTNLLRNSGERKRRSELLLAVFNIGSAFTQVSVRLLQNILSLTNVAFIYITEAILVLIIALVTLKVSLKRK